MKILLIRLDKIGDLVSTLPVDQISELAGHQVSWVISEGLGFIAENAIPKRHFFEIPTHNPKLAKLKLAEIVDQEKPDLAVIFYAPWWASYVLWKKNIKKRFGRLSWWHSWIFLTNGLRQKRSLAEKHEADYNLELLVSAIGAKAQMTPTLKLGTKPLRHLYEKFGLRSKEYFVVHPGMAGSALNWPTARYLELIEKLKIKAEVVITGTKADDRYISPIIEHFKDSNEVQSLQGLLTQNELLFILKNAKAVVAPSTGVAHLSASLGTPTIGLYSPIKSQHPRRWKIRGPLVEILVPNQSESISEAELMSKIQTESVLEKISSLTEKVPPL